MNINIELLLAVNAFARSTPWLQPLMLLYSTVAGFVVFSELMLAGWWLGRRRPDLNRVAAAIWTPAGMLLALAINQPISKVLAEPRPYLMYPDLWTTSVHSLAPGFPSDHAVLAGAVTATLFLVSHRARFSTTGALLPGAAGPWTCAPVPVLVSRPKVTVQ